jgi:hypothetical protein
MITSKEKNEKKNEEQTKPKRLMRYNQADQNINDKE